MLIEISIYLVIALCLISFMLGTVIMSAIWNVVYHKMRKDLLEVLKDE